MDKYQIYADLLENSRATTSRWKRENRKIIHFLEKYFSLSDITEYLKTGHISKYDRYNHLDNTLKLCIEKYISFIKVCDSEQDFTILYLLTEKFNEDTYFYGKHYSFDLNKFHFFEDIIKNNPILQSFIIDLSKSNYTVLKNYIVGDCIMDVADSIKINTFLTNISNMDMHLENSYSEKIIDVLLEDKLREEWEQNEQIIKEVVGESEYESLSEEDRLRILENYKLEKQGIYPSDISDIFKDNSKK